MEDKLKMVQTLVEKDDELKNVDDRYTKVQANNHRFEWSGKQLDILLRRVAEGNYGGSAFEDYTSGGGTKTEEEFLPAFVESVDNSELFFVLPEGIKFPYILTEDDKVKLEKAIFIVFNDGSGKKFVVTRPRSQSIQSPSYIGSWVTIVSTSLIQCLNISVSQINPSILSIIDNYAVHYTTQTLNDDQKAQARTNIDAEKATIVENVEEAEVTLDVKGGRKYMCGELTSLTLNSIEKSADTTVIYFTSGATPTQFVYPEDTPISGWDQPEANKIYLICVFNGNLSIEPYE